MKIKMLGGEKKSENDKILTVKSREEQRKIPYNINACSLTRRVHDRETQFAMNQTRPLAFPRQTHTKPPRAADRAPETQRLSVIANSRILAFQSGTKGVFGAKVPQVRQASRRCVPE